MKLIPPVAVALLGMAACLGASGAGAAGVQAPVTFNLQVAGQTQPDMTFWVAYGPLGGRFGLVRLRADGQGKYTARRVLPVRERSVFAYLAGYGVIHTRAGAAPAPPVVTIRRFGPVAAIRLPTLVRWEAPVG